MGLEGGGAFSPPEVEGEGDQKDSGMSVGVLSTHTRRGPWCRDEGADGPPPPLLLVLLVPL